MNKSILNPTVVFPLSAIVPALIVGLISCANISTHTLYNTDPSFMLTLHPGLQWEYWKISKWPYDQSQQSSGNVVIKVTNEFDIGAQKLRLDPIIDYGYEPALWLKHTHIEQPTTMRLPNPSLVIDRLDKLDLESPIISIPVFGGLRVSPHYFSSESLQEKVLGRVIGLRTTGIGDDAIWAVTQSDERVDSVIIKPDKIPGGISTQRNIISIIGCVFHVEPDGGSEAADFSSCYLANTTAGLADLTIRTEDPVIHNLILDPLKLSRIEENHSQLVPKEWWELAHHMDRKKARLVIPSNHIGIRGWSCSHWGWVITSFQNTVTVPAGTFNCIEITRYGHGYQLNNEDTYMFQEYWTAGVGMIARIDFRKDGNGIWVLADYSSSISSGSLPEL